MSAFNSKSFEIKNNRLIYFKKNTNEINNTSVFIINISDIINLTCFDKKIFLGSNKEKEIIIDEFINDYDAVEQYKKIYHSIYKYHQRLGRKKILKSIIKWFLIPIFSFIFIISLYSTVLQNTAFQQIFLKTLMIKNQDPNSLKSATPDTPDTGYQHKQSSIVGTKQLAVILEDGTKSGLFTINSENPLSKTKLFVFTDPLCPYCQKLDKVLNEIKSEYSVYLYPVNVISNDAVLNNLAEISCESDVERKKVLWNSLINNTYSTDIHIQDDKCFKSIEANSNVFKSLGLAGTPAVFNENGIQIPNNVLENSIKLKKWIAENAQ